MPTDVLYSVLLLYKYEGVFKDALHKIKFEGEAGWLPLLREEAELALPTAKMRWLQQFDLITCVPTAPERRRQRGFDVPQELFDKLKANFTEEEIVVITAMGVMMIANNYFNDILDVTPDHLA